jgi:hypothetical protein
MPSPLIAPVCSYGLLCQHQPAVSMYLADCPSEIFQIFDAAAKDVVLELFPSEFEANLLLSAAIQHKWWLPRSV